jgi:sigma-E factor negative regulatory protein RseA
VSNNQETLSSFIDGQELSVQQLDQLIAEAQSSTDFERYHLIGDAIRDELSPEFSLDFSSKVSAAIALEPAILAPKKVTTVEVTNEPANESNSNVVSLFGRFGSYGIAASVAAVMVVSAIQLQSNQGIEQSIPVLQTIPTGGYASPVSLQAPSATSDIQQQMAQKERLELQRRMNAYVKDHLLQQRLKSSTPAPKE